MNLSGNMTRQVEADMSAENDAAHVANIGRLVEDMELKMRNLLRMLHDSSVEANADFFDRGGIFREGKRYCWRSSQ